MPSRESLAYLGLGSNMGDMLGEREEQLEMALAAIERIPTTNILRKSPIYESKPWGYTNQPDFLNMVVEVSTNLDPHKLLQHCQSIERAQGRPAEADREHWGPRPIDIDILLFGDRQIKTATLFVPHPRMWERNFVLRPLADLLPETVGPDGTSIKEMLRSEKLSSQELWAYEDEPGKIGESDD